jgi:hypothetical protein
MMVLNKLIRTKSISVQQFLLGVDSAYHAIVECNTDCETDGTTILSGPVADQAELYGLLRKVRDLCLTLISINPINPNQPNPLRW